MTAVWNWLLAHWQIVAAVALVVLPALATGLSRYPRAAGVVHWLRVLLDLLSVVTHADSPGSLKLPLVQRSKSPAGDPPPPVGVGMPLCLLLAVALAACTPRQVVAWQALRADAAGCLAPGAKAAMAGAVDNAIKDLAGDAKSVDWKAYGIGLAANYGGSLALCIIAAAIDRLGPVILGGMAPGDPRVALGWLDAHRSEWLP